MEWLRLRDSGVVSGGQNGRLGPLRKALEGGCLGTDFQAVAWGGSGE